MKKSLLSALSLAGILFFSGCTTHVSDNIPEDGVMQWDDVTFLDMNKTWIDAPTHPNAENLGKVEKGMSKDQVYFLIGHPHHQEGLYAVREWDYVFNLKKKAGDPDKICQFKIIYDKDYRVGSTFYNPKGCADVAPVQLPNQNVELESDFLFDFDKDNLKAEGHEKIAAVAKDIDVNMVRSVKVYGYTDPLGSDAYNKTLSQQRANMVKNELIANGIPASKIQAIGMGEADQVKFCPGEKGAALKECLKPNRRVVIKTIY
ncbi:OmpA family protein [Campylobacter sp. JMF_01 NE2]|uniref:OmpA family protein n=1 Tax=unclassified Campylobacter TaxID=2593542 RepID=UPI0022E9A285|nr:MULTISPECIES: OmpA family protein [unclassified Campylobacter]MDA3042716.1 OmpA family protein [Campylobacter sp. JMF_09 ED2]MDA3044449.1 OmpA family protein [Campylobacter sp. JMF_07 ED4]MDA3046862.1 OmpA family protein [Campylobacter sp. VBCF_06 NA8]MDA3048477.1 OmpA family protein [Campylobacter sp. JMF_08 NE1]MDA3051706.1 OmpA family protein [Campylobacter sp. JMF_02 ED1]